MRTLYSILIGLCFFSANAQNSPTAIAHSDFGKANILDASSANFYQSALMNKYNINYLKLDFSVVPNNRFISGNCLYKVVTKQALDTFAIEFKETMILDSVKVNNVKMPFTRSADHIYIAFSPVIAAGTSMTLQFFYYGTPQNGVGFGPDNSIGLNYTANVSEAFQAREWFPAKQLLNDKIDSTDTWITTTNPNLAGSNGLLKAIVDMPNNQRQFQWSTRYPMSYYMPCFSVANYIDYRNYAKPASMAPDSILVQHYVVNNQSYFNDVKVLLDKTPRFIEKMSELVGLYPFAKEKYGHLQASIGGGMEHQTMSTMQNFNEFLVAHELAHQWFGDNVTCATWNDIWLNESFATYLNVLMMEKLPELYSITAGQEMEAVHNNVMSQPGGSVYVPLSESYNEGRIFDSRLSYNKGSSVIHNLRFEMQSDTLFFRALKTYQTRYKDTFATTANFKQVVEEVAGRDFTEFFNQWIFGEGYPTYNITYSKQADTLILNVNQTTSMPSVTPLFKGLMEYKIRSSAGDTIVKVNQTTNNQTFKIFFNKPVTSVDVDPNNWVINKVGSVTALPVRLISFTGSIEANVARLKWTANEQGQVKSYEVQRSADGTNFNTIATVFTQASNAIEKQYASTDIQPFNKTYYRLKVIDSDGQVTYSTTLVLQLVSKELVMYYNNQQSTLTIKAFADQNEKLTVSVLDAAGRRLLQQQKGLNSGSNEVTIRLKNLSAGVYFVEAVRNGERKVLKISR